MGAEDIAARIEAAIRADSSAGRLRPASSYRRMFPGFENLVTPAWERAAREAAGALRAPPAPAEIPPDGSGPVLAPLSPVAPAGGAPHATDDAAAPGGGGIPGLLPRGEPRFVEGDPIAQGGMGLIRRVRDAALARDLARKELLPGAESHPGLAERLAAEARVTAQLDHPGVVPVHDVSVDAHGNLRFTMKLVVGRTLESVIADVHGGGRGGWTLPRAVGVFLRVCETLAFAHDRSVIHRDLKPANVMVGEFGEVYVMDWGLAKVLGTAETAAADPADRPAADGDGPAQPPRSARITSATSSQQTLHGTVLGTPAYMPPEQARGELDRLDARSDIYSLGATLYELLSGRAPYSAPDGSSGSAIDVLRQVLAGPPQPLADIAPHSPGELRAICEKAMSREPADRYDDAGGMRRDLEDFLEGRVVRAYRTGLLAGLRKWVRRNRALASAIAACAAVAASGAVLYWRQGVEAAAKIAQERDAAVEQGRRAEAGRLSVLARIEMETSPRLALELALAAHDTRPGEESASVMFAALDEHRETIQVELLDHDGTAVAFSPDGSRVLASDLTGQVLVVSAADGSVLGRMESARETFGFAVSPGDRRLVLRSAGFGATLFDPATLEPVGPVRTRDSGAWTAEFDAGGERVAVGSEDGTVRILDAATGAESARIGLGGVPARACGFAPSGRELAILGADGVVRIHATPAGAPPGESPLRSFAAWDAADREATEDLAVAVRAFGRVAWLDGGSALLVSRCDGLSRILASADGGVRRELSPPFGACVPAAEMPDGVHVLYHRRSADGSGVETRIADARAAGEDSDVVLTGPARIGVVRGSAVSPDGRRVALCGAGERAVAVVHDAASGRTVAVLRGFVTSGAPLACAFDRTGRRLATVDAGRCVRIWEVDRAFDLPGLPPQVLALSNRMHLLDDAGEHAVVFGEPPGRSGELSVVLVGPAPDRRVTTIGTIHSDARGTATVRSAAFSADGRRVVAGFPGSLRVHDTATGALVADVPVDGVPSSVALSGDGRRAAVRIESAKTVAVHDVTTGSRVDAFPISFGAAWCPPVFLDRTGERIAVCAEPRQSEIEVRAVGAAPGAAPLARFSTGVAGVHQASFSDDGGTLLCSASGGATSLADAATGRIEQTFLGGTLPEARVWLLRGGEVHAASTATETRISDRKSGARIATLRHRAGSVAAVAMEPDGGWVRTLHADGTMRRWPLDIARAARESVRGGISVDDRWRLGIGRREDLIVEGQAEKLASGSGLHLFMVADSRLRNRDPEGALAAATTSTRIRPRYSIGWLMRVRARAAIAAGRPATPEGARQRAADLDLAVADLREAERVSEVPWDDVGSRADLEIVRTHPAFVEWRGDAQTRAGQ